ncbi:thioredoxin reductase (NADPH) [Elusimicrobium simillimum]|uniref:thioredoxin-disulfide reductase n=1 Tax=Elusimicrobium simillimum TaxID=3143438 RepID=UPI003C70111B
MVNTDLLVIGAGPAGITAGIYGVRAGLDVTLFKGPSGGGQLIVTNDIENYPGFIEPVSGFELMDTMHKQAVRLGIKFVEGDIVKIDSSKRPFIVTDNNGAEYAAKAVIIATGSRTRWLGTPGEDKYKGRGVTACATCDGFFYKGKDVVVVGGGNTAFEDALFLSKICNKVYLVHRREGFRAAHKTVEIVKAEPKVEFVLSHVIDSIEGDVLGVTHVNVKDVNTGAVKELKCNGVFMAVGGIPQTDFLAGSGVELHETGQVKVDEKCHTNIEGIFAAGDCADPYFRQAIIAAGNGAKAAIEAINLINLS